MAEDTHTDFEIAIERELHGALDRTEAAQLAEHLLGCASCRAYQNSAVEMETNMQAIGNLFSQGVVWGRVKSALDERVRDERTRFTYSAVIAVIGLFALLVVAPLVRHRPPPTGMAVALAIGMPLALFVAWRRVRKLETSADDATSSEALYAALEATNRKQSRLALLGITTSLAVGATLIINHAVEGKPQDFVLLALFGLAVIEPALRLVRLRRQRKALLGG